jgi:di/tricarboxylate transporter
MSKLIKRALKNSILPAILMIAGKVLGIFIVSAIYSLTFEIGNDLNGIFSTQIYFYDRDTTLFVNSYSDLLMFMFLAIPTVYFILKTAIFQSTLDNPKTIVKVTRFNILQWITKDNTTFLKIFIWTAFLWIVSAIVVLNTLQDNTYIWIGILSGVTAFLCGLGAIKTFEVETNKVYPDSRRYY